MHIKKARDKPSAATARHARDEIFISPQNTHIQTLMHFNMGRHWLTVSHALTHLYKHNRVYTYAYAYVSHSHTLTFYKASNQLVSWAKDYMHFSISPRCGQSFISFTF